MMAHILLITISNGEIDPDVVEAKLDRAKDWLRYAPGCWLVHTKQSADIWFHRLTEVVSKEETLMLICEVNLEDRSGRLSPKAWSWIKNVRQQVALAS